MTNKIIKQEQGRSMVEMLGTLAIIGVLSVGGIAGYTYGMNKYYTNELLAGASQRAVILKSQKAAGLSLSLREFDGMEVAGGEFGQAEELEDGSAFIIPVSGVKGSVCENLIKATEGTDITIANDDETFSEATCDDDNPNNLAFVFKTGSGSGDNTSGCSATQIACGTSCCPRDAECVDSQCVLGEVTCAEGEDMSCIETDENGECIAYSCCSGANTGDLIVGLSNAYSICATEEDPYLYCYMADAGECYIWDYCSHEVSLDFVAETEETGEWTGGNICCAEGEQITCDGVRANGRCDNYGCAYLEGMILTENIYGDLDAYCEENMTPYKYWSDDMEVWFSDCCSGTVTVGTNGESDTCEE